MSLRALSLLALPLGGCILDGTPLDPDPPDLDPFYPELLIIAVEATCADGGNGSSPTWEAPNDDVLTVFLRNELWAGRVELTLHDGSADAADAMEEHKVFPSSALSDLDPDGSWDEWTYELPEAAAGAEIGNANTHFNCAWFTKDADGFFDKVALRLEVFEGEQDEERADCVVWGHRSMERLGDEGCACAEEWTAAPPAAPCG